MTTAARLLAELTEHVWARLRDDLDDLEPGEVDWRPLPEANSIATIVRHLRLEAEWQVGALEADQPMPATLTAAEAARVAGVTLDLECNLRELDTLCSRFVAALRATSVESLEPRGAVVYRAFPAEERGPPHLLGYHHAIHLAMHWGQIRSLRNLYRTTHGRPARFVPDNPTFPPQSR